MYQGELSATKARAADTSDRATDQAAVETYFRKYFPGLVRFLIRKVDDADQAADIAQTAFERLAKLDEPAGVKHPRALLHEIARNLVVDQARQEQVRRRHAEATRAELLNGNSDHLSPEEIALHRERLDVLKTIIEALPGKRRRIFILGRIHDMTLAEIAANEGMSKRAVRGHIERALVDIRAEMARTFDARANGKAGKEHNGKHCPKL